MVGTRIGCTRSPRCVAVSTPYKLRILGWTSSRRRLVLTATCQPIILWEDLKLRNRQADGPGGVPNWLHRRHEPREALARVHREAGRLHIAAKEVRVIVRCASDVRSQRATDGADLRVFPIGNTLVTSAALWPPNSLVGGGRAEHKPEWVVPNQLLTRRPEFLP